MSEPITPEELLRLAAVVFRGAAAEIERLQSALDAAPVREERAGACFCEPASLRLKWFQHGRSFVCLTPCWINEGTDDAYLPGNFCQDCGAELGDGIARRWKERE
jgi:hypothetical protein